jgi:excinuclease ABC subunit B
MSEADYAPIPAVAEPASGYKRGGELRKEIERLRREMQEAADRLDFERAAALRDKARRLQEEELGVHV